MTVVVAFKWARDPEDAAVRSDGSVDWRGAHMVAGEDDPAALVVARAVGAAIGGEVVGLTIGDGDASWALARGIERVVAVPEAPSFVDDAVTAALLAAAVRWVGAVDLVVIGDAKAHPGVPVSLAAALGWPVLLDVSTATCEAGRLLAGRRIEDRQQTVSLGLPVVLGVAAGSAEKQAPGMKEILAARKRPITAVTLADLGFEPVDRLESRATRAPELGSAHVFEGSPESACGELVAALRLDGVL